MDDADLHELIGKRLRDRRRKLDMSQKTLAHLCGIDFRQVHRHETGAVTMPFIRMVRLAAALGVSLDYFLKFEIRPSVARHDGVHTEPSNPD